MSNFPPKNATRDEFIAWLKTYGKRFDHGRAKCITGLTKFGTREILVRCRNEYYADELFSALKQRNIDILRDDDIHFWISV